MSQDITLQQTVSRPVPPGFQPILTRAQIDSKADFLGIGGWVEDRIGDLRHVVKDVVNFAGTVLEDIKGYPIAFIKDPTGFIQAKLAAAQQQLVNSVVGGVVGVLTNIAQEAGLTPLVDGLRAFADVVEEISARYANLVRCGQYMEAPIFWAATSAIFALRVTHIVTTKKFCKQFMGGEEFAKLLGGSIPVAGLANCAIDTAFEIPLPAAEVPPMSLPPGVIPINGIKEKSLLIKGGLGAATTAETLCPDHRGVFQHYERGSIYWSPATGAWEVHGSIREKWASLGWEAGFLGYPCTDEMTTPDGIGRYNHFQGGSIYWTPATGAREIHGSIRDKWARLGWERGFLGYPLTDETATPDGVGRFNHFQGGSIYWTPQTGAREIHGAIRDKWAALGWERSALGYPTSDEGGAYEYRFNRFQGGYIYRNLKKEVWVTDRLIPLE